MTSVIPTFSGPVIVREAALDRTKSPKYALSDMQGVYKSIKWSNIGVSTNGSSGTASMNNTQYIVVNGTDKPRTRMNVYTYNAPNSFVFTNNDVKDNVGTVTTTAKPLQLTIFKKVNVGDKVEDKEVVVIENLAVNQSYILHMDDNLDIYCTQI
jgi:hypothetical protein